MKALEFRLFSSYEEPWIDSHGKLKIVLGVAFLVCLLLKNLTELEYIGTLMTICFIAFILSSVVSHFSVKEARKTSIGNLKISRDGFTWAKESVKWEEVRNIEISRSAVLGEILYMGHFLKWDGHSDGINEVYFQLKSGKVYEGYYEISGTHEVPMLKKIFEEVVDGKKVNLDIAKVMLEPVDYLDLQVLKERVKG